MLVKLVTGNWTCTHVLKNWLWSTN